MGRPFLRPFFVCRTVILNRVIGMVVYIDSVFLLNALLDGLLLYFTGYLAGIERRIGRILLSALCGGAYAAALFFPFGAVLSWPLVKLLVGAALVWLAYGTEHFWRLCLLFLGISCVLAGVAVACGSLVQMNLYRSGAYLLPVSFPVLLASSAACFGALFLFSRGSLHHRVCGEIVEGECRLNGQRLHLRILRDSGNTLCDPLTGAPVLVVEGCLLERFWPEPVRGYLAGEGLLHPEQTLSALSEVADPLPALRLLPYRSVGMAEGLLLLCPAFQARIGAYRVEQLMLALSPTPVSEQKEYDALWGGPVQ